MDEAAHRPHRVPKSGPKAEKKKERQNVKRGLPAKPERHNPRAFSTSKIGATKKNIQRNLDRMHKKEVVPAVDRTETAAPPPCLVAVMGPPRCGKSTLIRSLVKSYTGQTLTDVVGPITLVSNKKRRLTFFEVPADDLNSMIDLAKIADLVLIMINGSYGFEMETFEFLNLLQAHGFPKVMGICTHLDHFTRAKSLSAMKKQIKHRFWTEIYQGAKMFFFSGVVNSKYLKHEIRLLTLQVSRLKFRPLTWRNQHPYLLVDRVEDMTPPDLTAADPGCDRSITLYGFLRGAHLKPSTRVHLIGVGDFGISELEALPDPCPLPDSSSKPGGKASANVRQSLRAKETLLYAPMANVGSVKFDRDATYIDLARIQYTKTENLDIATRGNASLAPSGGGGLIRSLQEAAGDVDRQLDEAEISLFSGRPSVRGPRNEATVDADVGSEDEDEEEGGEEDEEEEEEEEGDEDEDDDSQAGSEDEGEEEEEDNDYYDDEEVGEIGQDEEDDDEDDDDEGEEVGGEATGKGSKGKGATKSERWNLSNADPVVEAGAQWKDSLASRAEAGFHSRASAKSSSLQELIYGDSQGGAAASQNGEADEADAASDDEFFRPRGSRAPAAARNASIVDSNRRQPTGDSSGSSRDWTASARSLRNRFVTGDWEAGNETKAGTAATVKKGKQVAESDGEEEDEEVMGDFEDLETGEKFGVPAAKTGDESSQSSSEEDENEVEHGGEEDEDADLRSRVENAAAKALQKIKFDAAYDERSDDEEGGKRKKKKGRRGGGGGGSDGEEEEGEEDGEYLAAVRAAKAEQALLNASEFAGEGEASRTALEGFRNGLYVRLRLDGVACEFTRHFRPTTPVVLGGVVAHESRLGLVRARVRRHRWHKGLIKNSDPLVISCGWRRFQTIPLLCMEEAQGSRHRYLKYSPQHMHCQAVFYGPLVPPNTPLLGFKTLSRSTPGFRVALTGVALEVDHAFSVVKKLKLTGHPHKVFRNTAFIRGMFNSSLEVAKFQGAKIKTVSGIRGEIKKSYEHDEPGSFRATFEDKVLLSDIVICRLWMPVKPVEFYHPVTSLLGAPQVHKHLGSGLTGDALGRRAAPGDEDEEAEQGDDAEGREEVDDELEGEGDAADGPSGWTGMRTVAELRREQALPVPLNKDSLYKPVVRKKRVFNPIPVPKSVEAALPFASKSKNLPKKGKGGYVANRAVVLEPEERKRISFLNTLGTIRNAKRVTRQEADDRRRKENEIKKRKIEETFALSNKAAKKKKHRASGLELKARANKRT